VRRRRAGSKDFRHLPILQQIPVSAADGFRVEVQAVFYEPLPRAEKQKQPKLSHKQTQKRRGYFFFVRAGLLSFIYFIFVCCKELLSETQFNLGLKKFRWLKASFCLIFCCFGNLLTDVINQKKNWRGVLLFFLHLQIT